MPRRLALIVFLALVSLPLMVWTQEHMHHDDSMSGSMTQTPKDPRLPASEAEAKAVLEHSPRHGEFVDIVIDGSPDKLNTWIVYPEQEKKAGVMIVIHEIYGLSDWIRALADQLAADGFIAVTPDLISGMGPNGGGTESLKSRDDVVRTIRDLSPEETTRRLNAVFAYARKIASGNGKVGCIGFCWGGSTSFAYAVSQSNLQVAIVYYGSSPETGALSSIKAPVLGLYGGSDARVNATIDAASAEMKKLGKTYEVEIFDGAGHGFLRQQDGRDGANMRATRMAWPRTIEFLKKYF